MVLQRRRAERFALGGAADGPRYMFWNVDEKREASIRPQRDDRVSLHQDRRVQPAGRRARRASPKEAASDWAKVRGFADDAWKTWQGLLSYTKGELDTRSDWKDNDVPAGGSRRSHSRRRTPMNG